jgi:hypothetical protein
LDRSSCARLDSRGRLSPRGSCQIGLPPWVWLSGLPLQAELRSNRILQFIGHGKDTHRRGAVKAVQIFYRKARKDVLQSRAFWFPDVTANYFRSVDFERAERRVMSACCDSFLTSGASSDKSTPQKLLCGCRDSRPACISFGASCLIHAIRNFALFDPRCRITSDPGSNSVRRAPRRAPF